MNRRAGAALLAIAALALAAVLILILVRPPVPSRLLTIDELRSGADFELGGVRVQETYFRDLSQIDAGTTVAFLVHFADGTTENVSFVFQTFLCRDVSLATAHVDPKVVFSVPCGESSVLVRVL